MATGPALNSILGLHHITAIAGDPQRNLDFYTGVLGLRLVKLTVNFDDPGAYHLYYGNEAGQPGTILTFFSWPGAPAGRRGTQQATTVSFSVPARALSYWLERFKMHAAAFEQLVERFDEEALAFFDPDGLRLELVADANADARSPWIAGPIPPEYAIRGFHSVTLSVQPAEQTIALLTQALGFRPVHAYGERLRHEVGPGLGGALIDVLPLAHQRPGRVSVGTVHHVAWRTPNDEQQVEWRQTMARLGYNVTPIMDRTYFHSIYFREPGGVLFEIATDTPGFTVDQPLAELGTRLMLPAWLESDRARIERALPTIHLPQVVQSA